MKCSSQNCENYKPANKRTIALVVLICFISASLLTGAFILTHANHAHDHNGVGGTCAACAVLQNAENLLKQLGTAATGLFFSLAGLFAISAIIKSICSNIAILTPITLKIRMNN